VIVEEFLQEIDRRWDLPVEGKIRLQIIGASALNLLTDYDKGTDDADVLESADVTDAIKERLLDIAGKGTDLALRRGMCLQIVPGGVPLLPQVPDYRPHDGLNAVLIHLEIVVLDPVDVCVSKLKPFRARDRDDIRAMVHRGVVPHEQLVRLTKAIDVYADGAGADDVEDIIRNLHQIERDVFGVEESEIELPAWMDRY
jgi:hypothetical protein